jgi:hypothetical protein
MGLDEFGASEGGAANAEHGIEAKVEDILGRSRDDPRKLLPDETKYEHC